MTNVGPMEVAYGPKREPSKPGPRSRSRQKIDKNRNSSKAGGQVNFDMNPDGELLAHLKSSGSSARRDPKVAVTAPIERIIAVVHGFIGPSSAF